MIFGAKNLAEKLGVSRMTIYAYIKKGMPCHRISKNKLAFDYEEVIGWIKEPDKKLPEQ